MKKVNCDSFVLDMKTYNPIRSTVTNFVTALGKRRKRSSKAQKDKKPKKSKMSLFFNDLENRGPFVPNSLFESWTRQIRTEMQKERIWVGDEDGNNIAFVAEYISRLMKKFFSSNSYLKKLHAEISTYVPTLIGKGVNRELLALGGIYVKIRIWGLRMKLFELRKWNWEVTFAITNLCPYDYNYGRDKDRSCCFVIRPGLVIAER